MAKKKFDDAAKKRLAKHIIGSGKTNATPEAEPDADDEPASVTRGRFKLGTDDEDDTVDPNPKPQAELNPTTPTSGAKKPSKIGNRIARLGKGLKYA